MASSESPMKTSQQICIQIQTVTNLRGSKGENGVSLVKVEFNDKLLGECPKFDFSGDTSTIEINYTTAIHCNLEDVLVLDDLAHKPVVVTIVEVLPKEKKQKEEKVLVLGQLTLDLFSLLKGEAKVSYELPINAAAGSPLESLSAEIPTPMMAVNVSVPEPIIDESMLNESNLLSITVESCYSPPDSWTINSNHMYTAALPLPLSHEKEYPVVFANGVLKPNIEKEVPNKQKKWPNPAGALGMSTFIPDCYVEDMAIEKEDGDLREKDDREFRQISEAEKNRVTWNIERRCYLHSAAITSFQERIAKSRFWPIEVFRSPLPQTGKSKGKEDEGTISFHGICYMNLAPLLYPGVKRVRGAYKVEAFTEHDLFNKTNRKTGITDESVKIAGNIVGRSSTSPWPKKKKVPTATLR